MTEPAKVPKSRKPRTSTKRVLIDFTDHLDLYQFLQDRAKAACRLIDQEILFRVTVAMRQYGTGGFGKEKGKEQAKEPAADI